MGGVTIPVRDDIRKYLNIYARIRALIENDEDLYETDMFCLSLPNEPPNAKDVRRKLLRKAFDNITHDLLNATKDAIFNEGIRLEFKESDVLKNWVNNVTLGGDDVSLIEYAADVVTYGLRAYGHVWTVLDKPTGPFTSMEDEIKNGAPYLANIYPGNIINYEIVNGELIWIAYYMPYAAPWLNPLEKPPAIGGKTEIRVWTQNDYYVIRNNAVVPDEHINHNFGFVPVVYQQFIAPPDDSSIIGISPFFTSSNLIIYANNMQSVGDMELFKHGSSVLLVHEESINNMNSEIDETGIPKTKLQDAKGYNKYVYSGENAPRYLTKDLNAVGIANRQADHYFMAAVQNERSLQSVSSKRETVRESGETKVYDAAPARAALRATAQDLEKWCIKVLNMAARLYGREDLINSFTCEFPDRYIISNSAEEKFKRIEQMIKTKYPSVTGMKEAYKSLTADIAHDDAARAIINTEIEENTNLEMSIQEEIDNQIRDDLSFEESIADLSDEEKADARAKRQLNV